MCAPEIKNKDAVRNLRFFSMLTFLLHWYMSRSCALSIGLSDLRCPILKWYFRPTLITCVITQQ